jgi:hypothetical protein
LVVESKIISLLYTSYERAGLHLQFNVIFYQEGFWFSSVYDTVAEQWDTDHCDYKVDVALEERFKYTYTLAELDELQKVYLFANEKIPSFS